MRIRISAFYRQCRGAGRGRAPLQQRRKSASPAKNSCHRGTQSTTACAPRAQLTDIDHVVFYDKPFTELEASLKPYYPSVRKVRRLPEWRYPCCEKLFQKLLLAGELKAIAPEVDWQQRLTFCEHHLSHAASAFYPSPFDRAVVLTLDGVGEWTTTAAAIGSGKDLTIQKEIHFPHSLGLLYSAFTYYTGFKVNSGEYKLMGLAPYGTPKYEKLIATT